jgi:hypothetical protein
VIVAQTYGGLCDGIGGVGGCDYGYVYELFSGEGQFWAAFAALASLAAAIGMVFWVWRGVLRRFRGRF